MGTGGPISGGKLRQGSDADHSPHLVSRSRTSTSYPLPLVIGMAVANSFIRTLLCYAVAIAEVVERRIKYD